MVTIQFANGRTKTVSERRVLVTVTLFFLVFFTLMMPRCPPAPRESSRTVAALRPTMERIANHGGVDADMWLFRHFNEGRRLQAAVQAGDPSAQYLQGRLLTYRGHRRAGVRLIRRSAAAGYPCAVMREDLPRKNSFISSCW